jgi:hypothetical protein
MLRIEFALKDRILYPLAVVLTSLRHSAQSPRARFVSGGDIVSDKHKHMARIVSQIAGLAYSFLLSEARTANIPASRRADAVPGCEIAPALTARSEIPGRAADA